MDHQSLVCPLYCPVQAGCIGSSLMREVGFRQDVTVEKVNWNVGWTSDRGLEKAEYTLNTCGLPYFLTGKSRLWGLPMHWAFFPLLNMGPCLLKGLSWWKYCNEDCHWKLFPIGQSRSFFSPHGPHFKQVEHYVKKPALCSHRCLCSFSSDSVMQNAWITKKGSFPATSKLRIRLPA